MENLASLVAQISDLRHYGDGEIEGARKQAEDGLVDLFRL